ncbi:LANO_0C03950g1_1 [Lachancea nothofagi CBS 11611]|uniref:LANO_0C03950g1_1 n=1 Tax=Lachancea nothofagi CBS 11611 TaxID=1266666 RepID=A0A1G4J653_9SACH|nr:LANO_0C03950g1_1 [Lachancea nothofagi CBS 11611]
MGVILNKRYYLYTNDNGTSSGWVWGRWLLFIVLAVVLLLYVFLLNVRRRRSGRNPIRGTAWLAPPPSYGVSQNQYNLPTDVNPVPEYSTTANVNDAGFFDQNGKFHRTNPGPQAQGPETQAPGTQGAMPMSPEPAVTRDNHYPEDTTSSPTSSIEYQRPNVPPPSSDAEAAFKRPGGPPPAGPTL